MSDQKSFELGEDAKRVLENPAFIEAMGRLHEIAHRQFKAVDIRDAEGLKLARQFAAVTDDFESILKRMVEGGKLAQLNLDKHRDESKVRRAFRQVTR